MYQIAEAGCCSRRSPCNCSGSSLCDSIRATSSRLRSAGLSERSFAVVELPAGVRRRALAIAMEMSRGARARPRWQCTFPQGDCFTRHAPTEGLPEDAHQRCTKERLAAAAALGARARAHAVWGARPSAHLAVPRAVMDLVGLP